MKIPLEKIETESNQLVKRFMTLEKALELTDQSSFVLCPCCSYPMFSTELNDFSQVTVMVEGVQFGSIWCIHGGLIHGSCPSCGTPFTYDRGVLSTQVDQKAIFISDD